MSNEKKEQNPSQGDKVEKSKTPSGGDKKISIEDKLKETEEKLLRSLA